MTNEEINNQVAEIVMGWKMKPAPFGTFKSLLQCWHKDDQVVMTIHQWQPTSDQGHAMKVADRIDEIGGTVAFEFRQLYDGFNMQQVDPGESYPRQRIDPIEICLAALKAVGGKV